MSLKWAKISCAAAFVVGSVIVSGAAAFAASPKEHSPGSESKIEPRTSYCTTILDESVCYPFCSEEYYSATYVNDISNSTALMDDWSADLKSVWLADYSSPEGAGIQSEDSADAYEVELPSTSSSAFLPDYAKFLGACDDEAVFLNEQTTLTADISGYMTDPTGFLTDLRDWAKLEVDGVYSGEEIGGEVVHA
jgi:hypothetical protein